MAFLADEFLCDVACDYACKCVLLAFALTIIERSLLADRPAFFVTAGRRGGGKTTVLMMLLVALTGVRPSAAAWSSNEEERRKALLAYFLEGVPVIIWDNIPRGTAISCSHIEKSCTTEFYSDRRLGVTETITVSAATVHAFTGNNIGPKGDLASRSLQVKLDVDRADPENRSFKHPDPIGWTEAHRCQILRALYTILLDNPAIRPGSNVEAPTRFKTWWRLVGSAVENAALQHMTSVNEQVAALVIDQPDRPPQEISFRDLFLAQEADDEDSATLADILAGMAAKWPDGKLFKAADVADVLNQAGNQYAQSASNTLAADLRDFLYPKRDCPSSVTGKSVGNRLKKHVGDPVKHGDRTFILRSAPDTHTKVMNFTVQAKP
jgi:hypothetical protein